MTTIKSTVVSKDGIDFINKCEASMLINPQLVECLIVRDNADMLSQLEDAYASSNDEADFIVELPHGLGSVHVWYLPYADGHHTYVKWDNPKMADCNLFSWLKGKVGPHDCVSFIVYD